MAKPKIAIIGGSGHSLEDAEKLVESSYYGVIPYTLDEIGGVSVVRMSRHGSESKRTLPHQVNTKGMLRPT